MNKKRY